MSDSQYSKGVLFLGKGASVKTRMELAKMLIDEENLIFETLSRVVQDPSHLH